MGKEWERRREREEVAKCREETEKNSREGETKLKGEGRKNRYRRGMWARERGRSRQ